MAPSRSFFRWLRNALTVAVGILSLMQTWATESPDGDNRAGSGGVPRIQFAETTIDFGRIQSGEKVSHDFIFTNTGNHTLDIKDVRPSCGCTTSVNWARKVEPGQSGTIPFEFNSTGFSGDVLKTIIVLSSDPQNTNVVLRLKAYIVMPVEIAPPLALFTPIPGVATNEIRILRITNHLEEPLILFGPVCSNPVFETQLRTNKQGRAYELQVALRQPAVLNNTFATISLKTTSTKTPEITIPARVLVNAGVSAIPERITLPAAALASETKFTVTVRSMGTNVLALTDASVNAEGASADIREIQPGRMFRLTLTFPAGFRVPPGQKVEARVKTNQPLFPELKIPVTQGQSLAATIENSADAQKDQSQIIKN